jgi:tungstate transport system substrate-binding protein
MKTWIKMIIAAATITVTIVAGTLIYFQYFTRKRLMISTTTSLYDTGLLDEIEKAYEAKYFVDLNFISVGTGIAIQHAQSGDVDLTLVHSPSLEKDFLTQGYGVCRKIIAYNFFTVIGPATDPAGIEGSNVTAALKKIVTYGRQAGRIWVSRGDGSGTHTKEQSLWKSAGFNYTLVSAESWYASGGGKMGETLLKAEQFSVYTLADTGTYLKYLKDGRITLEAFMTEEKDLLNVYSVMAVNQTLHPQAKFDDAITFIKYLISDEGQQLIENYGKNDYGQSLFYGAVQLLRQNSTSQIVQWIKSYAFIDEAECPPQYIDGHPELYG